MGLFDAVLSLGIIAIFIYLIYRGIKRKNPGLGEVMSEFSPMGLLKEEKAKPSKEEKKQIWTENRKML